MQPTKNIRNTDYKYLLGRIRKAQTQAEFDSIDEALTKWHGRGFISGADLVRLDGMATARWARLFHSGDEEEGVNQ